MMRFLGRRLAGHLGLAVLASCLGYLLASVALDPAARFAGRTPPVPPATVTVALDRLGVDPDVPLLERLWHWVVQLLTTGSLGRTSRGTQVVDDIVGRAGTSLRLLLVGTALGALVGVAVGVRGAISQNRVFDRTTTYGSFVVLATPVFVVGTLLMVGATRLDDAVGRRAIPFTGEYTGGLTGGFWVPAGDRAAHLLLPTLALALAGAATYSRYQRSAMLDVLSADYVRTARAKGRTRRSALVRHGVRVALVPMSTFFAYSFGLLLTGAAVVELTFSWHGMGEYLVASIANDDVNAAAGTIAFTAVLVLLAGTAADLLHSALDPRVRG